MKLDILAIGAHPDDVEFGCGGTLLKLASEGKSIGIIDLTQGEMGTRGTIETRYEEAANAAKLLGLKARENLKMKDIIKKINEFSKLARERELTEEEKKEREKYRKMYIEKFKESVRGHLDSIKVVRVDDDGNPIDDDGNVIEPEA